VHPEGEVEEMLSFNEIRVKPKSQSSSSSDISIEDFFNMSRIRVDSEENTEVNANDDNWAVHQGDIWIGDNHESYDDGDEERGRDRKDKRERRGKGGGERSRGSPIYDGDVPVVVRNSRSIII
jgi:hypothetical protein